MEKISKLDAFINDKETRELFDRNYWVQEIAREDGHKAGLIDGKKIGLKKGLKKGQQEKSIEIAKRMLEHGDDIEYIHEMTNLSIQKVKKLAMS